MEGNKYQKLTLSLQGNASEKKEGVKRENRMTESEKFLNAFKRLENAVVNSSTLNENYSRCASVLDYENILMESDKEKGEKLKVCRIIRNYHSHHEDGSKLFPASKAMTDFLDKEAESLEKQELTVEKVAKKTGVVTDETSLAEIIPMFAALPGTGNILPYIFEDGSVKPVPERIITDCMNKNLKPAAMMRQKVVETLDISLKKAGNPNVVIANITSLTKNYQEINKESAIVVINEKTRVYKGIIQVGKI